MSPCLLGTSRDGQTRVHGALAVAQEPGVTSWDQGGSAGCRCPAAAVEADPDAFVSPCCPGLGLDFPLGFRLEQVSRG